MSAIFGIYHPDGNTVDKAVLQNMQNALVHRGHDRQGVWQAGPIGLGSQILWTTPESRAERMPRHNQAGHLVITADARIDNRDELIDRLGLFDRSRKDILDSDIILAAYGRWGDRCGAHLVGDYAFVIWDQRKQAIVCVRDPFGIKPFYYHNSTKVFAFATEIKPLFCHPDIPRRINELRVAEFLVNYFDDKSITFYQEIHRLPPAHTLTLDHRGMCIKRYWGPDLSHEMRLDHRKEYVEAFKEVFTKAVKCRLRSAYPVGSTLSGGLDSSSVVCTAGDILSRRGKERLHTFSAIFPSLVEVDPRIDERAYMDAVLAAGEYQAHFIEADSLSPIQDVFWLGEEPMPGINLNMDQAFFSLAKQSDIRVFLSGHDGDTTISHGFELLRKLATTGKWISLFRESTALSEKLNIRLRNIIWRLGIKPLLSDRIKTLLSQSQGRQSEHVTWFIDPSFADKYQLDERLRAGYQRINKANGREIHWNSINSGAYTYSLELLDKLAAPYALEPRYPYFDRRLIEHTLALPPEQKLHQGSTRAILRYAMNGLMPNLVQWRSDKGNLRANFLTGLFDKEKKTLEKYLINQPGTIQNYVDLHKLQEAYQEYARVPLKNDRVALAINSALILALWLDAVDL